MLRKLIFTLAALLLLLPLAACQTQETEEGELPEYEAEPAETETAVPPVATTMDEGTMDAGMDEGTMDAGMDEGTMDAGMDEGTMDAGADDGAADGT